MSSEKIRDLKSEFVNSSPLLKNKVDKISGKTETTGEYNPFLKRSGELVNKYINYQQVLDNPKVSAKAKQFITEATGLIPTAAEQSVSINNSVKSSAQTANSDTATASAVSSTKGNVASNSQISGQVGKRIANTSTYNNDAAKGQCVWYVRGRASEKLGKDTGAIGNANQMWYNAKSDAKLSATAENIKPNIIVSYKKGTSSAGQSAGHVIYIEDVVGDTVYYTEGGSGYYKNGTDGVVKTASKQDILNGVNSSGNRIGSGVIGFIDLSKY